MANHNYVKVKCLQCSFPQTSAPCLCPLPLPLASSPCLAPLPLPPCLCPLASAPLPRPLAPAPLPRPVASAAALESRMGARVDLRVRSACEVRVHISLEQTDALLRNYFCSSLPRSGHQCPVSR